MCSVIYTRMYWVHHPVWGEGWLRYLTWDKARGAVFLYMVDNTSAVFTALDLIENNIQPFHNKAAEVIK